MERLLIGLLPFLPSVYPLDGKYETMVVRFIVRVRIGLGDAACSKLPFGDDRDDWWALCFTLGLLNG